MYAITLRKHREVRSCSKARPDWQKVFLSTKGSHESPAMLGLPTLLLWCGRQEPVIKRENTHSDIVSCLNKFTWLQAKDVSRITGLPTSCVTSILALRSSVICTAWAYCRARPQYTDRSSSRRSSYLLKASISSESLLFLFISWQTAIWQQRHGLRTVVQHKKYVLIKPFPNSLNHTTSWLLFSGGQHQTTFCMFRCAKHEWLYRCVLEKVQFMKSFVEA